MSNIFKSVVYDQLPPSNLTQYPIVRHIKTIHQIANVPTTEQKNKWESVGNIRGQIVGMSLLPFSGLGAIVSLETGQDSNKNMYRITVGMFPVCTCPDFVNMAISATGGWQKYLYYLQALVLFV